MRCRAYWPRPPGSPRGPTGPNNDVGKWHRYNDRYFDIVILPQNPGVGFCMAATSAFVLSDGKLPPRYFYRYLSKNV